MFDPGTFRQPPSALAKSDPTVPDFQRVTTDRFNAKQIALYFGMVKCIDDNIGRILDELREHEILDRTIVVFTSDHGDMCGELGRHNKGIPCEGSARIPFVMRAPGLVEPGTVIHEALGTVDFKPTLLGLLGVEDKAPCEGRDASKLFASGKAPADWENIAFVRIGSPGDGGGPGGGWIGAFTSRHKLVVSPSSAPGFFDLETDPNELRNGLANPAHRAEIRRLAKALLKYAEDNKEPHLKTAAVKADLDWAIGETENYELPPRPVKPAKGKGRGKKAAS